MMIDRTTGHEYEESLSEVSGGNPPTVKVIEPSFPECCRYAPHALAMTDEYQALVSKAASAVMLADRFGWLLSDFIRQRAVWRARSNSGESPWHDPEEIRSFCERAARAMGPIIGELEHKRDELLREADGCHEQMKTMERDYRARNPIPEDERWMKQAAGGIEA